jgi:carboxyl-terminal processing protease
MFTSIYHKLYCRKLWACLIFFFVTLVTGCSAKDKDKVSTSPTSMSAKEAALFYSYVTDRVKREYIEKIDDTKLLEGALNGILSSLDPYSAYLDPGKYETIKKQTQGHYGGLGIEMVMEDGVILVISALDDSPAQKAGVLSGDQIIAIDKEATYQMKSLEAAEKLRGKPGTEVTITIKREKLAPFDLILERAIINTRPIKWNIEDNIAYIRISTFNQETTKELLKAIREIKGKTNKNELTGYILDLRNNSGGLLDEAVSVSDVFLNGGKIVSIRGKDPKKDLHFSANPGDFIGNSPLMVLINGGTASAAEIVAAALQDNKRAVIVGTKSFGKGSVQSVIPLTNKGAIKLTIALYYTPSGKTIQKNGIEPDIKIDQHVDLKTINEDRRLRENNLKGALPSILPGKGPEEPSLPAKITETNKKEEALLKDVPDYQLKQAFSLLKAMSLYEKIQPGKYIDQLKKGK